MLLVCVILTFVAVMAKADSPESFYNDFYLSNNEESNAYTDPYEEYFTYDSKGTVISTRTNVRAEPSTGAKKLGELHNGEVCHVIGKYKDWYLIDLYASSLGEIGSYGFVREGFLSVDPFTAHINGYNLYDTPWDGSRVIGVSGDEYVDIISESNGYVCIQFRDGRAGSCFIRRGDLFGYSYTPDYSWSENYSNPAWILLTKYTTLFADPWRSGKKNGEKSAETLMRVVAVNEDYYCVKTNDADGGTSFILKNDVGELDSTACYVAKKTVIKDQDGNVVEELKRGEILYDIVAQKNGKVVVSMWDEENNTEFFGYVDKNCLQPILN
jgi:hypothetical protein